MNIEHIGVQPEFYMKSFVQQEDVDDIEDPAAGLGSS